MNTFAELRDAVAVIVKQQIPGAIYDTHQADAVTWRYGAQLACLVIAFWPPGTASVAEQALVTIGPPGTSDRFYVGFDARPEVVAWLIISGLTGHSPQ